MPDHVDRDIDMFLRTAQHLRQLFELARFEQPQIAGNDLPRDAALAVPAFDLQQQALSQIARAHARRLQRLHRLQAPRPHPRASGSPMEAISSSDAIR